MAQVEAESEIEGVFLAAGWTGVPTEETSFHLAALDEARARCGSAGSVVTTVDGTRALAVRSLAGGEVGRVRGELNGEWLGVHGLQVEEPQRRRGHARELMAGLLDAGSSAGASTVWLEVADDNGPALALYADLGFRRHHACRYLAAPASARGRRSGRGSDEHPDRDAARTRSRAVSSSSMRRCTSSYSSSLSAASMRPAMARDGGLDGRDLAGDVSR